MFYTYNLSLGVGVSFTTTLRTHLYMSGGILLARVKHLHDSIISLGNKDLAHKIIFVTVY